MLFKLQKTDLKLKGVFYPHFTRIAKGPLKFFVTFISEAVVYCLVIYVRKINIINNKGNQCVAYQQRLIRH